MEFLIIALVWVGFGFVIYKIAQSKNREPGLWVVLGILFSPIIIIIILAILQKLPKQRTRSISRPKKRKRKRR